MRYELIIKINHMVSNNHLPMLLQDNIPLVDVMHAQIAMAINTPLIPGIVALEEDNITHGHVVLPTLELLMGTNDPRVNFVGKLDTWLLSASVDLIWHTSVMSPHHLSLMPSHPYQLILQTTQTGIQILVLRIMLLQTWQIFP